MSVKKDRPQDTSSDRAGGEQADRAAMDAAWEEEGLPPDSANEAEDLATADANEVVDRSPAGEADWEAQYASQQERVLRLHAEMENLRSRTARELAEQRKYGCLPLLKDLVPVLDNIDRAIESAQQEDSTDGQEGEANPPVNASGLLEGFQLVRQQLLTILEQHHCESIEALGLPFDPLYHEAILQQPSADQPKDHVMMVTQTGYKLYDRVVRASQVIVSAGTEE